MNEPDISMWHRPELTCWPEKKIWLDYDYPKSKNDQQAHIHKENLSLRTKVRSLLSAFHAVITARLLWFMVRQSVFISSLRPRVLGPRK